MFILTPRHANSLRFLLHIISGDHSKCHSLINCKVELKDTWTKYCVLPAAGNDVINENANANIFTTDLILENKGMCVA